MEEKGAQHHDKAPIPMGPQFCCSKMNEWGLFGLLPLSLSLPPLLRLFYNRQHTMLAACLPLNEKLAPEITVVLKTRRGLTLRKQRAFSHLHSGACPLARPASSGGDSKMQVQRTFGLL